MKLSELRVERIKQELSKLALPTVGTKNELQRWLREELRNRGIDADTYDFEDEEAGELLAPVTLSGNHIPLLAAFMEKMDALIEARAENQKLPAELRKDTEQRIEAMQQEFQLKFERKLEESTEKPNEILVSFGGRVTSVAEEVSSLEEAVDTEVSNLEKSVD